MAGGFSMGKDDVVLDRGTILLVLLHRDDDDNERLGAQFIAKHPGFRPSVVMTDFMTPRSSLSLIKGMGAVDYFVVQSVALRPIITTEARNCEERFRELRQMISKAVAMAAKGHGHVLIATSDLYLSNMMLGIFNYPLVFPREGWMYRIVVNGDDDPLVIVVDLDE